jgi:hypothetical protein
VHEKYIVDYIPESIIIVYSLNPFKLYLISSFTENKTLHEKCTDLGHYQAGKKVHTLKVAWPKFFKKINIEKNFITVFLLRY